MRQGDMVKQGHMATQGQMVTQEHMVHVLGVCKCVKVPPGGFWEFKCFHACGHQLVSGYRKQCRVLNLQNQTHS